MIDSPFLFLKLKIIKISCHLWLLQHRLNKVWLVGLRKTGGASVTEHTNFASLVVDESFL